MHSDDPLTFLEFLDSLPQVLALLADQLENHGTAAHDAYRHIAAEHGLVRSRQNFDLGDFLIEYRVLRRVVLERIEAGLGRRSTLDESLALHSALDEILQRAISTFIEHHHVRQRESAAAERKYLSFLSHDLRNHLNGIMLSLEVLKRRLQKAPGFEEDARELALTQDSILDTIAGMDRLLQTERLRKENPEPRISPVDLYGLTSDLIQHHRRSAQSKGLALILDVPRGTTVNTDREWLSLILTNLIGNAIKFSQRGQVTLRSHFPADRPDVQCILTVSDQGPGIPPEHVDRLFETFRRGPSHDQPGVGLGLAVASHAAQRLRAQLKVDSTPGQGTSFHILLPPATQS
jgi:signal transduction histidine kinase